MEGMKTNLTTNNKIALALGIGSLAALSVVAGPPVMTVQVPAPPPVVVVAPAPPAVVVQAPAPSVTVEMAVPDVYVWDGVEFVGVVGTQYYYLGPDKLWLPFDAVRVTRFHEWEKAHADWRVNAIRNDLYRRDAHGHEFPRHDDKDRDHASHDQGHDNHGPDHDNGHGHDHQ
jgi:hypothetical protein